MRRIGALIAIRLCGTLLVAVELAGCRREVAATQVPRPVNTSLAQTITVGNTARYSASIVPYSQVDLAFQSSGYVDRIRQVKSAGEGMRNIDEGDWVKKGTVLAVVRQQSYQDKLEQANAQLARARAEYDKAKLSFDRVSALYSTQSATKPDFDSAQAQLDSTAASVSGAEAQVSEAKVALGYTSLEAPFDGWIVKRTVDAGSFVGPATNGFTIANTRTVKAVFGMPDTSMSRVKIGQRLNVSTDAFPQQFLGRISVISPSADPKSRVFSVEVAIDNAKNQLRSGMIASVVIDGEVLPKSVVVVPLSAVIRDPEHQGGFAVMTIAGEADTESAHLRPVALGDVYGNMIGATRGLKPGDRVVTTGVTLLSNGETVRVIR